MEHARAAAAFVVCLGLTAACGLPQDQESGADNTVWTLAVLVSVT